MGRVKRPLRWSVIGVGRAGQARARAIARDGRCRLVAFHHRSADVEIDAPERTLEEAIQAADAVAVCSPTPCHGDHIRRALEADRHVLVEFPLSDERDEAEALFELARARERVLHVEHIELLDPTAATLRAHVRPELVEHIDVRFEREGPQDVGPRPLAWGNVARLHRVVDLGGPVTEIQDVQIEPGQLTATVKLSWGAQASLSFAQDPYFRRRTFLEVRTVTETWKLDKGMLWRGRSPVTLFSATPLFELDQSRAVARMLDGAGPYVPEERILHVLDVAEALAEGRTGPIR